MPSMDEATKKVRLPSKGQLIRWIGTLVSSVLFIGLLAQQDWEKTWESLINSPVWLLPFVFSLYFMSQMLNTMRWKVLLSAQDIQVPFLDALKIVLTGAFASNFLPSTIGGDTVRVISLLRYNPTWSVNVATVVLDRLINVLAMLTILPFSFIVFGEQALALTISGFHYLPSSKGVILAYGGIVVAKNWLGRASSKLRAWVDGMWEILRVWFHRPRALILAFVLSWLSSLLVFVAIWVLARGLGMTIALYQVMGIMVLTYFLSMLPISINGYGLREVAVTTLYMQIGATLGQASTLAVITRFILLLEALPGALWLSNYVTSEHKAEGSS